MVKRSGREKGDLASSSQPSKRPKKGKAPTAQDPADDGTYEPSKQAKTTDQVLEDGDDKQATGASQGKQGVDDKPPKAKKGKPKASDGQPEFPTHPFYLIKSEPDAYSFEDLENEKDKTTCWEGVRNHQAKLIMRGMTVGQQAFFYHSNAKPPGIIGLVEVTKEAYPDHYQWDKSSKYYDASAPKDPPRWWMVDVKFVRRLKRFISLPELRQHQEGALAGMPLVSKSRLSVQPVSAEHWQFVLDMEDKDPPQDS